MQLALFPMTPQAAPLAVPSSYRSRAETRVKILVGVVVLGLVRRETGAAQAFLEAVERSSLTARDRASVKAFVGQEVSSRR